MCVIERVEKRAWWADIIARECFPRMYARGRARVSFWKSECGVRETFVLVLY